MSHWLKIKGVEYMDGGPSRDAKWLWNELGRAILPASQTIKQTGVFNAISVHEWKRSEKIHLQNVFFLGGGPGIIQCLEKGILTPPQLNGTMVGQFEDQNSDFEDPKFIQKARDISEISGHIRFLNLPWSYAHTRRLHWLFNSRRKN